MAGRKQREAPEVVKERIEIASIQLFALRGSAAVSVGQIATAVGMSSQAVLYHYGTKSNLYEAVTARILAVTGSWLSRFGTPDSLEVSVDGLTDLVMSFVADNPWVPIAILRELLGSPDVAQPRFQAETLEWRGRIADALVMGQQAGIVRADVNASLWFDRISLMLLATLSFPMRAFPLAPGSDDEQALRTEIEEAVRIGLTSVFVTPDPWLEGRGVESLALSTPAE